MARVEDWKELKQIVNECNIPEERHRDIFDIFMNSYEEHKQIHGSYGQIRDGYAEKMQERKQYQFEKVFEKYPQLRREIK